jgi:hypothetical protein
MLDYLELNDGLWRVRITIPPEQRADFGGKRYLVKTTGERNRDKAFKAARPIIDDFLAQLDRPRIKTVHLRHSDPRKRETEWYTPPAVFDAMRLKFNIDVASPGAAVVPWIPARRHFVRADDGLSQQWRGTIFCNLPFGLRSGMQSWLDRFVEHGDGILLLPSNTYTSWHQWLLERVELVLYVKGYVRFISSKTMKPTTSPAFGTALFAMGRGCDALRNASAAGLGALVRPAWHGRGHGQKRTLLLPCGSFNGVE